MHPVCNDIQGLHHENSTLEARKATKLHQRDSTPSNNEFPSYAQSIKFIFTRATNHPLENVTLDLYREGATLCKFLHEGRPTTTKRLSLLFEPSDETIRRLYGITGTKTTSTISQVTNDKCFQFQVNWLSIARDTSVKARPKKSSQNLKFCIPSVTLTLL